eukprot:1567829-Rhodomonas_salina.2
MSGTALACGVIRRSTTTTSRPLKAMSCAVLTQPSSYAFTMCRTGLAAVQPTSRTSTVATAFQCAVLTELLCYQRRGY